MDRAKTINDPDIEKYINDHSLKLDVHQKKIIERTMKLNDNIMLGNYSCAKLFQILVKSTNAKKCLEVGCYTGYTTLAIASELPEDGKIVTLDVTDEVVATDVWREAGLDKKIELVIGPAVESMDKLIANGEAGTYDFIFIDADKPNYHHYYERSLILLKKNGLIAIDNVLWFRLVLDETVQDPSTVALRKLNTFIKDDNRVEVVMLPMGDGVTLCRKI